MKAHRGLIALKVALFLIIAIAGLGQAVLHLWNWLMPHLFGLPVITFWQGIGLLALSWVLFGGWRGFHGVRPGHHRRWRGRMMERWEQMTAEEREKFRQSMRGRCGSFRHPAAEPKL
jgi:hypothetical protein